MTCMKKQKPDNTDYALHELEILRYVHVQNHKPRIYKVHQNIMTDDTKAMAMTHYPWVYIDLLVESGRQLP